MRGDTLYSAPVMALPQDLESAKAGACMDVEDIRSGQKWPTPGEVLTTPSIVTQGPVVGWRHDALRRLAQKQTPAA